MQEDSSANYEDERVSYSANGPVEATQDNYVPQALNKEEQTGLHCSEHSGKLLIASATYIDKNDKGTYNLFLCYSLYLHILNFTDILVDSAVFFEALLLEDSTANYEEQMVSHSANGPVEATAHGLYLYTFEI